MRVLGFLGAEDHSDNDAGCSFSEFMLLSGLEQLINEPTHLPRDEISTCIDLIITKNSFSYVDSGVIPSPYPRLKHQVIHGKINFSVPSPPLYKRKIWEYDKANVPRIKDELSNLNWIALFENKCIDEMVSIFTDSFLSIMTNNIPNKVITINDKDAPWVTPEVKTAFRKNSRTYKKWKTSFKGHITVQQIQKETHSIIEEAKKAYSTGRD